MKSYRLALVLLAGFMYSPAKADTLMIVLNSSILSGPPGAVLNYSGTITNTTGADVFLNADNFNLSGFPPAAIDDSPFFSNAPAFLGAFGSTGDIGLFDITIPDPFAGGNYGGTFQVLGGADGNAQDVIGTASFEVDVPMTSPIPEPASGELIAGAVLLFLAAKKSIVRFAR